MCHSGSVPGGWEEGQDGGGAVARGEQWVLEGGADCECEDVLAIAKQSAEYARRCLGLVVGLVGSDRGLVMPYLLSLFPESTEFHRECFEAIVGGLESGSDEDIESAACSVPFLLQSLLSGEYVPLISGLVAEAIDSVCTPFVMNGLLQCALYVGAAGVSGGTRIDVRDVVPVCKYSVGSGDPDSVGLCLATMEWLLDGVEDLRVLVGCFNWETSSVAKWVGRPPLNPCKVCV